jgi:hypothetical protein
MSLCAAVAFFLSSIICRSGITDAYIVNMVNQGLAQYAQIFNQDKIEINEALVPQFCALWPKNFRQLGKNVILSGVAVLAQVGQRQSVRSRRDSGVSTDHRGIR